MANKRLFTVCPLCNGTGKKPLDGVYADTLCLLRKISRKKGYVVANQDAVMFNCKPTALSNRLTWLESHGLATSTRYGRERRYKDE